MGLSCGGGAGRAMAGAGLKPGGPRGGIPLFPLPGGGCGICCPGLCSEGWAGVGPGLANEGMGGGAVAPGFKGAETELLDATSGVAAAA